MGVIVALIIGLAIGAVAKLLVPGKDGDGLLATSLLGISGAVVAYLLGASIGWYGTSRAEGPGFIASVFGAVLLLVVYRSLARPN